jgi:hypothetical protein
MDIVQYCDCYISVNVSKEASHHTFLFFTLGLNLQTSQPSEMYLVFNTA